MKVNSETNTTAYVLAAKLSSHFKIKKDIIYKDIMAHKGDNKLVHSDTLKSLFDLRDYFYCIAVNELNISILLDYAKFDKSDIGQAFLIGEGINHGNHYKLAIHVKGILWVAYREEYYEGLGGIFLRDQNVSGYNGIAIEPIGNYLQYHYPKQEPEAE